MQIYYRDGVNDSANEIDDNDNKISNNKKRANKHFKYETKITEGTPNNNNKLDAEVTVPLKYLSNIWRSLDLILINCEIKLDLKWKKGCAISEISRTPRALGDLTEQEVVTTTAEATFQITNVKLYVPVVTLAISWRKYRSQTTTQVNNDNLDYLINSTIREVWKTYQNVKLLSNFMFHLSICQ